MSTDISASIEKVRQSTGLLNHLTDKMGAVVLEVEGFLNKECSAGIRADTTIRSEETEYGDTWFQALSYRRVGSRYRIAVVTGDAGDPDDWTIKPWSDCDRETKIASIAKLPALMEEIAKAVDSTVASAEENVDAALQILQAIKGRY